ncbi:MULTISPECIES: bifunctional 5,10-methylenetetrahydrofolate dehydrogenase/5,10-methenyltetrahydrofolate cyclohydrolase [Sphingobium]|uniref:bifunctional 5,10-methylenetetrahydrofolate dehydrogenase/5,10-methenyltetrahydrofolate cyclohydrolase n=1 Tax=Sphingobium TaxID=165695 RepID=UPI0015EB7E2A|nr:MULTISPECIES: tetrahydrofolate dehydrogenase/cyclohydrolase catalytic domain-containing protein [Sphingobium]MCW2362743.1 methylenetetrahydrofolate dehydrogenase (NADP+)/methenyltetrahydrofolate cyclohydrolase [Sphingobium sp. B10D3B]MCW2400577.1 methylenetetrahydrofolate dehydrogenase (NADP+)/methenyltetrahydrofolate cyclohydrolase [Sphingobium sp. B10D7B]MCW2407556.1 methylenetetrahydrofolate dehydrogenase (NADP+)/methenyltetrahydrofolate cyclohydrolase [Sphingobium xanthum]
MTRIVDGHAAARRLLAQTAQNSALARASLGRAPRLALLMMGEAAPARAYAARIEEFAGLAEVDAMIVSGPADGSLAQMQALVRQLNADQSVDGILPLTPFPSGIAMADIAAILSSQKDVDGLTPLNAGQLAAGLEGLFPCTPQAAVLLAEEVLGDLRGLNATVVGASASVGRPLAQLLLQRGVTVTIAHIDTRDLVAACQTADLLFAAAGRAGLIGARHVRPGATVIDIGINLVTQADGSRRILGDVDLAAVDGVAAVISAVPDGVGPLTTAFLLANTVLAAQRRHAGA